jgi:Na+-transporting NADH:ubiquinone oxidoreductase subunit NqrC
MGPLHSLNNLEKVLMGALLIALVCSIIICVRVYILNDHYYKEGFSAWQMPMIFAILADLYLLR